MKKGKIVMAISMGATSLILSTVMFAQFKTVEQTNITQIESMREQELRAEYASWKSKYDEANIRLDDVTAKVKEYKDLLNENIDTTTLINKDIAESEMYLGYTNVEGEGIVITLEDNDSKLITAQDIMSLINQLKLAGAEAISVNDERIVNTSDIALVNGRFILINGNRVVGPYVVRAIGNQKYLESAITIKQGYIDELKANDKNITYTAVDSVKINKYKGEMKLDNVD